MPYLPRGIKAVSGRCAHPLPTLPPLQHLLLRKLETEKDKAINPGTIAKEQVTAIKDKILELIKNSDEEGGIETEDIIKNFPEVSSSIINQEIQKFLEEGIAFEPRPGKIRWLG